MTISKQCPKCNTEQSYILNPNKTVLVSLCSNCDSNLIQKYEGKNWILHPPGWYKSCKQVMDMKGIVFKEVLYNYYSENKECH